MLTALLETSITDGLKSRLMQYLKHVVEDDVLFTSKFEPVTFKWVKLPSGCVVPGSSVSQKKL